MRDNWHSMRRGLGVSPVYVLPAQRLRYEVVAFRFSSKVQVVQVWVGATEQLVNAPVDAALMSRGWVRLDAVRPGYVLTIELSGPSDVDVALAFGPVVGRLAGRRSSDGMNR